MIVFTRIRQAFTLSLFLINLLFLGGSIAIIGIFKFLLPPLRVPIDKLAVRLFVYWGLINRVIMNLTNTITWEVECEQPLDPKSWYLIIANHRSWIDILVIAQYCANRIPMPRFFLKYELLYVPIVGVACWALDMPFMKRYSQAYLRKHPEKRGADVATTKRSCEKFVNYPTTVINFVEGTRITAEKHAKTRSPYKHLLKPKAGGVGYTLTTMGNLFKYVLDFTILYPDNDGHIVADLCAGRLKRIIIRVKSIPVDDSLRGDYFNDPDFKKRVSAFINETWQAKDDYIESVKQRDNPKE